MTALYLHDAGIYDAGLSFKSDPGARHILVPKGLTPDKIIKKIEHVCGPRNHFTVVVLNAHGNKDTIYIGSGLNHTHTTVWKAIGDALWVKNRGIEIHSCLFTASSKARSMADAKHIVKMDAKNNTYSSHALKVIAKAAGCVVKAGSGFQYGQSRSGKGDTDGKFETDWIKVNPVGAVARFSKDVHPRKH